MSRLASLPSQSLQELPAERVAGELEAVFARPEFDESKSWFQRAFEWLAESFNFDASPGAVGDVLKTIMWIVAGAVVIAVVVLFVREFLPAWRRFRQKSSEDVAGSQAHDVAARVAGLRAECRAARLAGDKRLALRLGLFALVVGLGQRGDLRYRDAWTNRELLDRGQPSKRTRELLEPLILEHEAKEFGHAPIEEGDLDHLEELCERWLGPLQEVAA